MTAPHVPGARPTASHPGAAYTPESDMVGAEMLAANVGPGAYADRVDLPDTTIHGEPKIVPLRVAPNFFIEPRDPDPRGMTVIGADGEMAGVVTDVWVDRAEPQPRYLEVDPGDGQTVLLPITACRFKARERRVHVKAILAAQFLGVPKLARPDVVTLLEEDRIMAYFAAGYLYATPDRSEPIL